MLIPSAGSVPAAWPSAVPVPCPVIPLAVLVLQSPAALLIYLFSLFLLFFLVLPWVVASLVPSLLALFVFVLIVIELGVTSHFLVIHFACFLTLLLSLRLSAEQLLCALNDWFLHFRLPSASAAFLLRSALFLPAWVLSHPQLRLPLLMIVSVQIIVWFVPILLSVPPLLTLLSPWTITVTVLIVLFSFSIVIWFELSTQFVLSCPPGLALPPVLFAL